MKLLLLNVLAMAITCSSIIGNNHKAVETTQNYDYSNLNEQIAEYKEVNLQERLFEDYYDELNDSARLKYTYKDFKDLYFSKERNIEELVDDLNSENSDKPFLNSPKRADLPAFIKTMGPDCYNEIDDADFVVSDNHNSHTYGANETPLPATYNENEKDYYSEKNTLREFDFGTYSPRIPKYYGNNLTKYRQYFHEGDIVWDTVSEQKGDFANLVTHMGMIVNLRKQGREKNKGNRTFEFVETVEAYASGVRFGFIDDERILRYGTKVLTVQASDTQKRKAVEFMLSQLGKPYTLRVPDLNTNGKPIPGASSATWYCTQLVFSAYYIGSDSQINLCKNNRDDEYYGKNGVYYHNVLGHMIYDGSRTSEVPIYLSDCYDEFLDIEVLNEGHDYYDVKIRNSTDSRKMIGYSDVMKNFDTLSIGGVNCSMKYMYLESNESRVIKTHKIFNRNAFQAFFVKDNRVHYTIAHDFFQYVNNGRCLQFNYVKPLETEDALYPKLFVDSVSNGKWKIGIANISSSTKLFYYKPKTCTIFDAIYWNNMGDAKSKYIYGSSFDYVEVKKVDSGSDISTNMLAFSHLEYGNRYVGYADELNALWKSLAFKQNKIGSNSIPNNTPTFPIVTKTGATEYIPFFPGNFTMESGHGQNWYEMHLTIPAKEIEESVWSSVIVTDYHVVSITTFTCDSINFDTENGEFNVTLYARELSFPFGAISVRYEYETELELDSIELSGKYKTTFIVGEQFSYDGLIVKARYTCGDVVETDDYQVFDERVHTNYPGSYPVTIQYSENGITKTKEYTVTVRKPYLDSIQLITSGVQTVFEIGEDFNYDGLTVRCIFEDGTWAYANSFSVNSDEAIMSCPGQYTIYVTCNANDSEATGSYQITVLNTPLQSIVLGGEYQTVFEIGEDFNYDGLETYALYSNGFYQQVDIFDVDGSGVDMNCPGEYFVLVEVMVNGSLYSTSYTVIVEDRSLVSIDLSGNQQTIFEVGDTFNYDGLVVTAHYANGDTRVVTDYTVITSTINMNNAGIYNVKVRYTENNVTVNATYQITVVYDGPTLTGITLSGDYQTSFQVGESFNHIGLVVTAHYSDGTSRVVSGYSVMPLSYNPNMPGTYNVVVNYSDNGGFALTSYSVTVEFLLIPVFLDSITLSGNYKTNYRMGQALNFTGLVVTANYSDGSSEQVTDYVIDTSAVNMLLPGYYDVRVLYTFEGTTAVAVFTIHIGRFIKDPDLPFLPDDPIKPFPGKF